MNKLHPKAKNLFFWQSLFIAVFLVLMILPFFITILGLIGELILLDTSLFSVAVLGFVSVLILLGIPIVAIIIAQKWAHLAYDRYAYELKEDGVHITKGVLFQKYTVIPYQKVQNVNIVRDPVSLWLGLATVQVQTAGMSGQVAVEGLIPGLAPDTATSLRNKILKRVNA